MHETGLVRDRCQSFEIPFVVERGKASYIGNLNFSPDWEVALRDRATRDLPALRVKYKALETAPVAYTIAEGAAS